MMKNFIPKIFFLLCLLLLILVHPTCIKLKKELAVKTDQITSISTNSAAATGIVIDLADGATQQGHCYAKTSSVTLADSKTLLGAPAGTGNFTSQLTNLDAGTKYYIKAYLSNGSITVYGEEKSFITLSLSAPTLSTSAITLVTSTTATSGGNITSDGGTSVTARGVCWNTSSGPSITNTKSTDGSGTGGFASSLTGLTASTTYYVRAYATNSSGTSYGNELSFSTAVSPPPPSASSSVPSLVTNTTATLNGNVNANNSSTTVTFDYGLTTAYGQTATAVQSPVIGSVLTNVHADLTGLTSGQTYHYRIKAASAGGTVYGADMPLTTTVVDREGYVYSIVTIDTQVWMSENLQTIRYNDGNFIPDGSNLIDWLGTSTGAYCWYDNDPANKTRYGVLYNWHTVNTGRLCPQGWHVPNDTEWSTLQTNLGGQAVAGNKLKETGSSHWIPTNTGADNSSGFTALPGGNRNYLGTFGLIGNNGYWWSTNEFNIDQAQILGLSYADGYVIWTTFMKASGLSVRCIRN